MSLLAPPPSSTSIYENGGKRHGGEMETQAPIPVQRRYTLNEEFHVVLAAVGAVKDKPYEWKDIIMLFIRYLANRKPSLLDPQNKSRVLCADDPIGRVFGVDCFTKEETRLLVRRHVSLVEDEQLFAGLPPLPPLHPPCPPAEGEQVKRGSAEDSSDGPDHKRSRSEAETAAGVGPSTEPAAAAAPAQLHRMDTLEVTDGGVGGGADGVSGAPVDATDDEEDHRKTYACEMEPVECTDVSDSECSSGESDIDASPQLTVLTWAEDFGIMADMETSESESELRDTWTCQAADCQHANSARKSRCDRCWKTRPSWVVGPRRKKRRQRDLARLSQSSRAPAVLCQTDGSVSSQDTGYGSQEMCSMASSSSSPPPSSPPPPPPPPAADQTCLICCEKSRDAAIIHGRTGCQVTCYGCARKLWKKRDLCPSCRRTIEKIVFMRFG